MTYKSILAISLFLSFLLFSSCKNTGTSVEGDTTGVSEDEIVIGAWGPLTGPAALWGSILKGQDAYFKMINEEGGIHGRKIRFIYKDDAYDPSRTVPAARELVQRDEVFAICGGIGTAPNMSVIDFLIENKVPWICPMSGAPHWTTPVKKNIYTVFPLYFDEGDVMAKYALNEMGTTKVGIIYQNDDFGKSGLIGAQHYLQQNNLDFVAALPVEVSDTDLSSHAARLKESGADIVLLWVLPRQAAIILSSCAVIDYTPQWYSSLVLSDMSLMHDITKGAWEGVIFNYVAKVMYYDESDENIIKYKSAFKKHYPDDRWGTFPMGGFLWAEPMVEGLRRAGRDLTRESFLEAMSGINNYVGGGGMSYTFSKENHLGLRSMYVMRCISATEAEALGDVIEGSTDVEELMEKL